jgi:ribonuclease Z
MAKIVFLGTGGWISSIERNESALLIETQGSNYLLDAGEATFKQIQKAKINFRKIKAIFVTHSHGDHVLGIPSVVLYRTFLTRHEIKIIYPNKIEKDIRNLMRYIPTELTKNVRLCSFYAKEKESNAYEDKNVKISCIKSKHTSFSVAYKIVLKKERKTIVYSGDTSPTENLVKFGKNSDILIHEASLCNKYENFSFKIGHSTVNQAISEGLKCNVSMLVLVHLGKQKIKKRKFKVKNMTVFIPNDLETLYLK